MLSASHKFTIASICKLVEYVICIVMFNVLLFLCSLICESVNMKSCDETLFAIVSNVHEITHTFSACVQFLICLYSIFHGQLHLKANLNLNIC